MFLEIFNKTAEFTTQKSTCLCLTLCNFVISNDFVKSICQSLKLSTLISSMHSLTSDFLHRLRKLTLKDCTISSLRDALIHQLDCFIVQF